MNAEGVAQLAPLRTLFAEALAQTRPGSVAILGVAGGNGLGEIDLSVTQRVVGFDIHPEYLAAVRQRYGSMPGLELHCLDLAKDEVCCAKVAHVHVALVFEHAGIGRCLENAVAMVEEGGWMSVVLQLPSQTQAGVSPTGFASLQALKPNFQLIAPAELEALLTERGLAKQAESQVDLAGGKGFWQGIFRR